MKSLKNLLSASLFVMAGLFSFSACNSTPKMVDEAVEALQKKDVKTAQNKADEAFGNYKVLQPEKCAALIMTYIKIAQDSKDDKVINRDMNKALECYHYAIGVNRKLIGDALGADYNTVEGFSKTADILKMDNKDWAKYYKGDGEE